MKMVIVLDKLCLICVIGASLYVGYKAGVAHEKIRETLHSNFGAED